MISTPVISAVLITAAGRQDRIVGLLATSLD